MTLHTYPTVLVGVCAKGGIWIASYRFTQKLCMHLMILPSERFTWIQQKPKYCYRRKIPRVYSSLQAAKKACINSKGCSAVSDNDCDQRDYYLCPPGSSADSWGGCVHKLSRKDIPGLSERALVWFCSHWFFDALLNIGLVLCALILWLIGQY